MILLISPPFCHTIFLPLYELK